MVVFLYAWAGYFFYRGLVGEENPEELSSRGGLWFGIAGFTLGLTPLVQMIHIWPVLALLVCGITLFIGVGSGWCLALRFHWSSFCLVGLALG